MPLTMFDPDWTPIFEFEMGAKKKLTWSGHFEFLPSLTREWMVEFKFHPANFDYDGWTNIFHMTTGDNKGPIGSRIPAVFYHPQRGLVICSHINGNSNYCQDFKNIFPWRLRMGATFFIRVSQELLDGFYPRYIIFILVFISHMTGRHFKQRKNYQWWKVAKSHPNI